MLSKNQISRIRLLHQKKYRDELNLFIAEGEKVVSELIASDFKIHSIYATEEATIGKLAAKAGKRPYVEIIKEEELEKISALTTPQGVLAVAEVPKPLSVNKINTQQLILVLDEIKDPGNLGTIIRIADWFGFQDVVCSENSADAFSPKVVQAAMGSLFRINILYAALPAFLKEVTVAGKLPVYGSLLDGENIYQAKLNKRGCIIIGNESKGISAALLPFITDKISIPSFSKGKIDSLNAAMAAAIVCSEFRRRVEEEGR
jgi:TrmH family RNA methyltransferase